ncbi:MAG: 3-dehydroquinate synthase [Bacteroidota bacterium]
MIENNVVITDDIASEISQTIAEGHYSKIGVIVDEHTEVHCLPLVADAIGEHWLLPIKSGEENKVLNTCAQLWGALTDAAFGRKDLIINLGGGVIGDMGGFVASTYKRGLDFVNLPTTLLAQVDASIGGKLGVDFEGLKNHIGLFKAPNKVIVYPDFIKTLSKRELYSGFAEVIKHALIKDESYWKTLKETAFERYDWNELIEHSIEIKKAVVTSDPYEGGTRKILNFGHTIGHAIETHFLHTEDRLLHGEAIAVGMICEAFLSHKFAGLSQQELVDITHFIVETYQPKPIDSQIFDTVIQSTLQDKKNSAGFVNYSLLKGIGKCGFDYQVSNQLVLDSLFYYNSLIK